jgi:surfeit locus 1 family protein
MRFNEYHFQFRTFPTLLLALPVPVFIALGVWQLDRAEQKLQLAQQITARGELPAFELQALVQDPQELHFRKVQVQGTFEKELQFFIENRRMGGHNGFHVISPLQIQGSNVRVLINRGWIADTRHPDLPDAAIPNGVQRISGEISIPSAPALKLHSDENAANDWGKRWPYLTTGLFAANVAFPLEPFVILQSPADEHGFVRNWPREAPKQMMHIGYALQWFAFALIAIIIYLKLTLVPTAATGEHT